MPKTDAVRGLCRWQIEALNRPLASKGRAHQAIKIIVGCRCLPVACRGGGPAYLFFILPRSGTVVTGAVGRSELNSFGGEVSFLGFFTILFCCMPLAMVFSCAGLGLKPKTRIVNHKMALGVMAFNRISLARPFSGRIQLLKR